jgi:23S rRNA (pseudouridine1915-N3)-methyltransferase
MHISFYTVGKGHEGYVREGIEEFTGRINRYYPCTWKIVAPARHPGDPASMKRQEAGPILEALGPDDYLVLLDERGKSWTSEQLSAFIGARASDSCRSLVFLIGGAYGVDEAVRNRARFTWSLSTLVFPHQLVRLLLAEQVYRACTILRNEKYHHS